MLRAISPTPLNHQKLEKANKTRVTLQSLSTFKSFIGFCFGTGTTETLGKSNDAAFSCNHAMTDLIKETPSPSYLGSAAEMDGAPF